MEVDPIVQSLVEGFVADWNTTFYEHPCFKLDYSIPSLASLDAFIFPIKGISDLEDELKNVIQVVAGYVGFVAGEVWSEYDDQPKVKLYIENKEVLLKATGGAYLPGKTEFVVNISQTLEELLTNTPNPFPLISSYKRRVSKWQGIISLFTLSLCCGGTPFGEGPWKLLPKSELENFFESASRTLADRVSGFYKNCFPLETKGKNPEVYATNTIVPPDGVDEVPLGVRAPVVLLKKIRELYGDANNEELLINLCNFPDQNLSLSAVVATTALSYPNTPLKLKAAAYAKSYFLPMQRGALSILRKVIGKPNCWKEEIRSGRIQVAEKLAEQEKSLYFTPLLYFPVYLLAKSGYEVLCDPLQWSSKLETIAACVMLRSAESYPPIDLYFQEIFIHCFIGDIYKARNLFKEVEETYSGEYEKLFNYHQLKGWHLLNTGSLKEASGHFEEAVRLGCKEQMEQVRLHLLWSSLLVEDNDTPYALAVLENCLEKNEWSLEVLIAKYKLLKKLGDSDRAADLLDKITRLYLSNEVLFEEILAGKGQVNEST